MSGSYAAARVHAMLSRNMTDAQYNRLVMMSAPEIFSTLQTGDYREDINALSLHDLDDLEAVDRMLSLNNRRLLGKIRRIAKGDFAEALSRYEQSNDAWNLRVILEALAGDSDPADAIRRFGRHGTFDTTPLERAKSVAEYGAMLKERYGITGDLASAHGVSLALRELGGASRGADRRVSDRATIDTERALADCDNIITILLLKRDRIGGERAMRYLRRDGGMRRSTIRAACDAADAQGALAALMRTAYGGAIRAAARSGEQEEFIMLEHELRRATLRRIKRIAGTAPLGPAVLMHYLADKEREHHNLRLVIKAKRLGLGPEFITAHLMMERDMEDADGTAIPAPREHDAAEAA